MTDQGKNILVNHEEVSKIFNDFESQSEGLVFILGAGASRGYTSRNSEFLLPPVVAELFDQNNLAVEKTLQNSRHSAISKQLGNFQSQLIRHGGDLEAYFSRLYNGSGNLEIFAELLNYIQYLFHLCSEYIDEDSATNNYMRLINEVELARGGSRPWTFITFNYDTILEKSFQAAAYNARTFRHVDDYFNVPNRKILKMHGGINFRFMYKEETSKVIDQHEIFDLMMRNKVVAQSNVGIIGLDERIPALHESGRAWSNEKEMNALYQEYNYPLMLIPIHATSKPKNRVFAEALDNAQKEIESAGLVFAIGYNFGDDAFLKKIKELNNTSDKTLILVGAQKLLDELQENQGYKNISAAWEGSVRIFSENGFEKFVSAIAPFPT